MKPFSLSIMAIVLGILVVSIASAMLIPANDNAKANAQAPENSPVIGENWDLERVDFIHYARSNPSHQGGSSNTCYKLLGVKWTTLPVNYAINPSNPQNLSESFITSTITASAETWDAATSKELFNSPTINYSAQYGVQNYQNAIVFGNYPDSGVIGVTSIWYTRVGKRLVEFDMLLNTDFQWGDATLDPLKMDLQNIGVHELGHGVGLGDIYSASCSTVTMFGYSTEGEISKRTLEQPDITGLQRMYGA